MKRLEVKIKEEWEYDLLLNQYSCDLILFLPTKDNKEWIWGEVVGYYRVIVKHFISDNINSLIEEVENEKMNLKSLITRIKEQNSKNSKLLPANVTEYI